MLTVAFSTTKRLVNLIDWKRTHPPEWYLHPNYPYSDDLVYDDVIRLYGQGQAIAYIARHFTNIPIAPRRHTQVWYGDHARFIVANINADGFYHEHRRYMTVYGDPLRDA
jgi:hypothetical protein